MINYAIALKIKQLNTVTPNESVRTCLKQANNLKELLSWIKTVYIADITYPILGILSITQQVS